MESGIADHLFSLVLEPAARGGSPARRLEPSYYLGLPLLNVFRASECERVKQQDEVRNRHDSEHQPVIDRVTNGCG